MSTTAAIRTAPSERCACRPKSASTEIFRNRRASQDRSAAYRFVASRDFAYAYGKPRQHRQFLQTDPVGYENDLNLYAYVRNDPISRFDPNGRDSIGVRFTDQPIHFPNDFVIRELRGEVIPQQMSGGHAGIVAIDEQSGLTRYREFGRYDNNGAVRSVGVSNLDFTNGVPSVGSVTALLGDILDIGAAENSDDIQITFDAGTDFGRIMDYVARVQRADPDWAPLGPNCQTFCRNAQRAGGGNGPRYITNLTRENVGAVAGRIVDIYSRQAAARGVAPPTGTRIRKR